MYLSEMQNVFAVGVGGGHSMSEYSQYRAFPIHCCFAALQHSAMRSWMAAQLQQHNYRSYSSYRSTTAAAKVATLVQLQYLVGSEV